MFQIEEGEVMAVRPTAIIISDFPIVAAAANAVFGKRYDVTATTWSEYVDRRIERVDLVVVDVTTLAAETALSLLMRALPETRVVVCSLHQNEVKVFHLGSDGLMSEGEFPSLLAFAA
jgi:hypothetical protein